MFYDHRFWSIFGSILVDSPYEFGQTCHFLRSISPISRSADFCHIRYVMQLARLTVSTPLSNLCGARARAGLSFTASKIAGSPFPIRIWLFPYDFSAPKILNALPPAKFRLETYICPFLKCCEESESAKRDIIYFFDQQIRLIIPPPLTRAPSQLYI